MVIYNVYLYTDDRAEESKSEKKTEWTKFRKKKEKVNMTIVKEILSWTVEILITLVIAFTFVYFIGLRTSVVGQSMSETLESGDEILVNRFIYKVSDPKPNDIIVFLPNGNEKSHYYVKRVIAVPGDTVLIQNGAVYVNGELFDEKVDVSAIEEAGLASEELKLEDDEYFVLGDNRNNSEDSRYANIGNVKKITLLEKHGSVYLRGKNLDLYKKSEEKVCSFSGIRDI